mgnify:CR=1 FL=1
MDALQSQYETAFRSLLWRLRPRRLERGVQGLLEKARASIRQGGEPPACFAAIYRRARERVIRGLIRHRQRRRQGGGDPGDGRRVAEQTRLLLERSIAPQAWPGSPDFHCDSGLGGMARWLRAAGYDALFWPRIEDDLLIEKTAQSNAILLTTDRPLMNRSAVAWGAIPALLVPLDVGKHEQFRFAARQLGLTRKTPRCMSCGGTLHAVPKESVRDRIPPRTYPWRDEYFVCQRCRKLFWGGTHWRNVQHLLEDTLAESE